MPAHYGDLDRLLPGGVPSRSGTAPGQVLSVRGPDARDFLQRLCSQDVAAMTLATALPAAFLTAKGRLATTARVVCLGPDDYLVATQPHMAGALAELLERYHFAERLEIAVRPGATASLIGPGALSAAGIGARGAVHADGLLVFDATRHRLERVDVHGDAAAVAAWSADAPVLGPMHVECLRIVAGELRIGVDTDASTLALEAAIDDHVSTTKGCYVGQEIVARIHTYGHVNRRAVLVRIARAEPVEPGSALVDADDGDPIGRVMSNAPVPDAAHLVGIGWLPAKLADTATLVRVADADGADVQVLDFGPP